MTTTPAPLTDEAALRAILPLDTPAPVLATILAYHRIVVDSGDPDGVAFDTDGQVVWEVYETWEATHDEITQADMDALYKATESYQWALAVSLVAAAFVGAVSVEAACQKCGETFNPTGPDDLQHLETEAGTECGGFGRIVGAVR